MGKSLMEFIALLPIEEQEAVLADMDMDQLMWDWNVWARPEQLAPEGDDWNVWLIMAGRGFGKFLRMSTPILCTDGTSTYFKTIGDIQTGDTIFDENGKPTKVLQAHVPDIPKRMFRLTFSDGTTLDAGEEHQWVTWTHSDRKAYNRNVGGSKGLPDNWPQWKSTVSHLRLGSRIPVSTIDRAFELVGAGMSVRTAATKLGVNRASLAPHMQAGRNLHSTINYARQETGVGPKIRNTQEIVDSFTYNDRGDLNHSIPVTGDVSTPIADLLIDPYLLGYWEGDGNTSSGGFTQHRDDMGHLVDAISAAGYTPTEAKYRKLMYPNTGSVTARGLSSDLRKIGVLGNKHIPAEYLYASADQRWELLAGLLDSDGFIDAKSGYIEFSNTNKNLADGVMFLARSLGQKPTMVEKKTHATAKDGTRTPGKLAYLVTWRPTRNFFKLPRKVKRFIPLGNQASRNFHRMIVSFEEITPILSRCLTVDSPNSMYLAGEALIPTHNTRLGAEWVREQAKYTTTGQRRFGLVARTAADVRDVLVEGESGIMNISPPSEKPHYEPSKRRLTWPNGNVASLFCVTPDTEALTKDRGWVTHGNLSEGDEILTLNTDTGSSEWNPVKGVHTFDVVDEPVARFSGRHHSSVSTLTHKWPVKLRNGEIKLTTTDSIIKGESHTKVRLITSAPCSDVPTTSTHSDALVELCAWYMTEGSVKSKDFKSKTRSLVLIDQPGWEKWLSDRIAPLRCHKKDGKPKIIKPTSTKNNGAWGMTNLIDICDKLGENIEDALVFYHQRPRSVSLSIAQSMRVNPDKCASIHKALTDLFGPEREKTKAPGQKIKGESWIVRLDSSGNGALNYYLDNDSSAKILEYFIDPVEKIPTIEFMNSLTVSQLEIFVNACMDGDGHRRGSSGSFEQKSAGRRDAFGYALTLLGYSHSYTTRHPKYKGETVTLYGAHYRGSAYTTLPRAANLQSSKGRAWGDGRSTYTLENYTGIVWCPTAKNKTWLARHDGKVFFTGNTADEPDGLRGPQFRLDIATPIPTPAGWSTMGDLKVGDAVFDELGKPCNVTAVHETELSLDSYRLNFSNGTHIDADGKHRWKVLTNTDLRYVSTHFDGVIPETWATERFGRESTNHQVKDTNQLRANTKRRLYIPATKAVTYLPSSEPLPINPWVLGLVLGDGASAQPSYIATSTDDKSWLLEELERSGLVSRDINKDHVWAAELIGPWRELGLYKNKHVPEIYLRASAEDRLALLQGLTDSDGGVEPGGSFRFTNTNKALIDGYIELARSLGLVPKVYARKRRSRSGLQLDKQSWYVQVNSPIPLVRNPRKLAKARYEWKYQSTQHSIVSIAPTTPKFMRCITVDSASHLYLAGEGMVPTSNTHSWSDEVAAWRQNPDSAGMTAFDNVRVGTRLGANPQMVVTTTPKRVPLLYKLIEEAKLVKTTGSKVVITKGSTLDNAGNLSGAYLDTITGVYEGTSLAQQELYGEMLDDVDGALWTIDMIEKARELLYPPSTPLRVIGVDPSVAENPRDACGIVVCASTGDRDLYKRHAWVLEDATIHGSPEVWANKVVEMARRWGAPVVAEVNQGGALVRNAINAIDPSVKVLEVHSKYGKALRAEPIVLAYEQSRIHHVNYLPDLESQMTSWIPEQTRSSPDRVDALVHAMTALLIKPPAGFHGGKLTAKSPAARKLPPFRSSGAKVFNPNR